jgi:3-hydroxy acid dehydrogenase / malonic semialdehyde reductase
VLALVTGASAGFGAAISRRLVRDGHRVIGSARRAERLEGLRSELGEAFLALPLDVTDAEAVAALPGSLPEGWREVDALVNNAGLALGLSPAQEADLGEWERMIATNVTGLVRMTHALLPGMVARGRGDVVNMGSVTGTYPYAGATIYGATKAFVAQFTRGLKADLVGTGVRATVVEPGLVGGTEFSEVRLDGDAERVAKVYEGAHALTPDNIAEIVAWVVELPPNVNINRVEVMPLSQGPGPFVIKRSG